MHSSNGSFKYIKDPSGLEYLKLGNIDAYGELVIHGFTTRLGGVSTGQFNSLNLGLGRNDCRDNVMENYRRISSCLGIDYKNMVLSTQVHDNKILKVGSEDRGKGILFDNIPAGFDGLMTNERQVALVTFYADCVPLFFFDPVKKVIALSHSGWKSTLKGIGPRTIDKMTEEYSCKPSDILAGIGPSIQKCCFEVGDEVYSVFKQHFENSSFYCRSFKNEGKWYIDLQAIIIDSLEKTGIKHENICNTGICTKCNNHTFFSHRGDAGKTGSMAAIMQLR